MLVGVGAERSEDPRVVDAAAYLAAVSRRPHVVRDAAVRVGPQGAAVGEGHAGPAQELGGRADADRDDHEVRRAAPAVEVHARDAATVEVQPGDLGAEHELDAGLDERLVDPVGHLAP